MRTITIDSLLVLISSCGGAENSAGRLEIEETDLQAFELSNSIDLTLPNLKEITAAGRKNEADASDPTRCGVLLNSIESQRSDYERTSREIIDGLTSGTFDYDLVAISLNELTDYDDLTEIVNANRVRGLRLHYEGYIQGTTLSHTKVDRQSDGDSLKKTSLRELETLLESTLHDDELLQQGARNEGGDQLAATDPVLDVQQRVRSGIVPVGAIVVESDDAVEVLKNLHGKNLVLAIGYADTDINVPSATKETSENVKEAFGS